MTVNTNQNFERLLAELKRRGDLANSRPTDSPTYQEFIQRYPLERLEQLSLDEYCVGKGDGSSFCCWIERGLEPVLGRYMPGTSRGHVLYFQKDGGVYKHRRLVDLSDQQALQYTLRIQATIAAADPMQDLHWVDDDAQIYERAGVEARVTVGEGRKLRLLSCYHPEEVLPISSSKHIGHYLEVLGCPAASIPPIRQSVARMLLLRDYYLLAKESLSDISPYGFIKALYSDELGLAPVKEGDTPDDPALVEEETQDMDTRVPLNQILYGPPGTGKTYETINAALEIIEPAALLLERPERHARFRELVTEKRVRFVTLHQSFSYEDFVEGLRALPPGSDENPGAALSYDVAKGVFVQLCQDAASDPVMGEKLGLKDDPTIWKISIEEASSDGRTRRYCFQQGEARIGWDQTGDLRHANLADPALKLGSNDQGSLDSFVRGIEPGDVLVCLGTRKSICAVGVVTGEYDYQPQVPQGVRKDYVHRLPVNWLLTDIDFDITALNGGVGLTLKTLYRMSRLSWPELKGVLQQAGHSLAGESPAAPGEKLPYVLIIDEINRGNVSRIFGELITLIEPSKRAGADEALEVVLPYSKKPFSVPDNVYLIGTMNTADRSLAGLDIALRRRFTFREMPPRPELLDKVVVAGVNIGQLLRVMNQRIEVLLDRDHCLGHAYFMPLESDTSLARMESIFRNQVLPLLQEYFFEDWQHIQWVLNDHRKAALDRFVSQRQNDVQVLFGNGVEVSAHNLPWSINEDAFQRVTAYAGIVSVQAKLETPAEVLEAAEA